MIAETAKSLSNIRGEMGKCLEREKEVEKTVGVFQKLRRVIPSRRPIIS